LTSESPLVTAFGQSTFYLSYQKESLGEVRSPLLITPHVSLVDFLPIDSPLSYAVLCLPPKRPFDFSLGRSLSPISFSPRPPDPFLICLRSPGCFYLRTNLVVKSMRTCSPAYSLEEGRPIVLPKKYGPFSTPLSDHAS